jgi:hypothetical protein
MSMRTTRRIVFTLIAAAAVSTLSTGWWWGKKGGEGKHFGEPFTQAPAVTITQLLETPDAFHRKAVRVKGTIERQCPAAGCWVVIKDEKGRSLKVEFGDYHPKLPMYIGHVAEAEGELIKQGSAYVLIGTRVTFTKKGKP